MSKVTDKKKSRKSQENSQKTSVSETIGFSKIIEFFRNERIHFIIGILLLAVSVCMAWSFVSFFSTGALDQSIIENLHDGDMGGRVFQNAIGSLGAWMSYFFMNQCFGVAAFAIPLFLLLLALHLIQAYKVPLLKWFMCITILMVWSSVLLAMFVTPLMPESHFCPGGQHGLFIGDCIERYVGTPGLVAILALVALCFLIYISTQNNT